MGTISLVIPGDSSVGIILFNSVLATIRGVTLSARKGFTQWEYMHAIIRIILDPLKGDSGGKSTARFQK